MRTALVALLLIGCTSVSVCPPLPEYSKEFQTRLADETARLPSDSAMLRALEDAYVLRQQVRACR